MIYLDDISIINEPKEGAEADYQLVKTTLEGFGFVINLAIVEILGVILNSTKRETHDD